MMRRLAKLLMALICVVLAMPNIGSAGIRPSFMPDYSAWNATDIILASEGASIDGELTVLETWKGNLKKGEVIKLPKEYDFSSPESRTVNNSGFWLKEDNTKKIQVTGHEVVLFLKRQNQNSKNADSIQWEPASISSDFTTSVAWIEGQALYSYLQVINPGPSELRKLPRNLTDLKNRVRTVIEVQSTLQHIEGISSSDQKASQVVRFIASDIFPARFEALRILSATGQSGIPYIEKLLSDNSVDLGQVVDAMAKAGGVATAEKFIEMLKEDLDFWRAKGPNLPVGWWNGDGLEWSEVEHLRNRYNRTLHILYALKEWKVLKAKVVVSSLRDYWSSLPQLDDPSGLNQMTQTCNSLLAEIGG